MFVYIFRRAWLIAMLFFAICTFAQLENANWYIPHLQIISFDLNGIKSISGTSLNGINEAYILAPATLSDSNGTLLFYSNYRYINYAPRNIIMGNGRPFPGSDGYFDSYIFKIPQKKKYLRIDVSNSRFRVVRETIDTSKAYPVNYDIVEFLEIPEDNSTCIHFGTAIGSDNCHGFWLPAIDCLGFVYLTKVDSNYQSMTWQTLDLLTPNVLGRNPRLNNQYNIFLSNNGKRLAISNWYYIYIFDFDAVSGKATFYKKFDVSSLERVSIRSASDANKFNFALSPNGKYLYILSTKDSPIGSIKPYQLDIETSVFYKLTDKEHRQAKVGIDNRLYISNFDNALSIIHKPDLPCPACDYRENQIDTLQSPVYKFPNTVENYYGRKYDFKISQTCIGDSVLFEVPKLASDDQYIWRFADGFMSTLSGVKRHISQEQKIHLRYNYCDVYDTAYVPPAKPVAISDTFLCAKNTLLLPPKTEAVLINNKTISGVVTINNGTNYALLANECFTVNDTFKVEILQRQAKPFGTDSVICHQKELILQAKAPSDYLLRWSDNSNQKELKITESGRYSLIRSNRCFVDTNFINITFVAPTDISKISNVITPNSDGINDTWLPAIEPVSNYERSIFNRWGALVHQTTEISEPWNAQSQADGIYFWHITYTDCNNQTKNIKGTVMVVR
ncbi:MAG: gliding motility-associated C-terminal domain-containing protein [Bacteroidetes bacterium]|nr:MAG: gliding motility-associated C-terminal domain-containing protein [Bacteroidota bacterium]